MMTWAARFLAVTLIVCAPPTASLAIDAEVASPLPSLKVPDGFTIELAAGPPLVERPIVAAFDDEGRLYVAESSGSNDKVQKQLEDKPHRIVRLEDTDGDGKFDKRIVFADHMMFPEGTLFFDGSLYVSAPPSIWKLTDKDGDGVADERVEWFKGGTLTGCANDLHGPYAGPDGWIYWCKGAFAEQTHVVNGKEWKTKAAHVFRCRPDGSGLEPVITAGMDNPVDVAFMPDGEMILSGTYFNANPRHDGLAHAVYGGVFGKEHGVLDGHPRTGELMPVFDTMTAAACCGLERYDSDVFGPEYRDNLFLCQFNLRKVSRHVLKPAGSTYTSTDSDFVSSDNVDFHPTDVVVDADGSLLVIDTGGWYKLCCPTSQLWKPDILGGIYRVRKIGAKPPDDPRGRKIAWTKQTPQQLWSLLGDNRPAVRQRACRGLAHRSGTKQLRDFIENKVDYRTPDFRTKDDLQGKSHDQESSSDTDVAAVSRAWALLQINSPESQALLLTKILGGGSEPVMHIAMQSAGLNRDTHAIADLICAVGNAPLRAHRRVAAEALGRIGDHRAVPALLDAAAGYDDRLLQHSIIYALIELADPAETRGGLKSDHARVIAATLIALDQMPSGDIKAGDVIPHLGASDDTLRQAARWVVSQHADWGGELAQWFSAQLKSLPDHSPDKADGSANDALQNMLVMFAADPAIQQLLADTMAKRGSSPIVQTLVLRVMTNSKLQGPPKSWIGAITSATTSDNVAALPLAIAAARRFPIASASDAKLSQALRAIADGKKYPLALRIEALSIVVNKNPAVSDAQFDMLTGALSADTDVTVRSAAADALTKSHLNPAQLDKLCGAVESASPLELNRLLKPFDQSADDQLGTKLLASLKKASSLPSLRIDLLREALAKYGPDVQRGITEVEGLVNVDAAAQRQHIEELLPLVAKGDIRRGHAIFYSSKAVCSSCHRLGNAGGTTGPDLSHVGKTRTERDILESILYPSLSFVRSYEPMLIITQDGKTINGTIHNETADEYVLATGPDQEARVKRADVEQLQPSTVSIMPAGLDKQLTTQELADLVAFLKNSTAK
jgi:putative membrane-bound dehydrogenase-like protein